MYKKLFLILLSLLNFSFVSLQSANQEEINVKTLEESFNEFINYAATLNCAYTLSLLEEQVANGNKDFYDKCSFYDKDLFKIKIEYLCKILKDSNKHFIKSLFQEEYKRQVTVKGGKLKKNMGNYINNNVD